MLRVARRSAVKARTQPRNQLHALVVTAPDELRAHLRDLTTGQARRRRAPGSAPRHVADPTEATKRPCAPSPAAGQHLDAEIDQLDAVLDPLVADRAPALVAASASAPTPPAQLLVTAGDNPDRLRTEAASPRSAASAPIQASPASTNRHRLNRGGDRASQRRPLPHRPVPAALGPRHPRLRRTPHHRRPIEKRDHPLPQTLSPASCTADLLKTYRLTSVGVTARERSLRSDRGDQVAATEDLAVPLGVGQRVERAGHAVEADLAGDHRRHVDLALGDRAQRAGELHRVVAEHELDVELLADRRRTGVIVSGSMHTPTTDDAGAARAPAQRLVDDPGHADRLEHHERPAAADARATRRTAGSARGSTTSWAPICAASARRAGEKSAATIGSTPRSLQRGDHREADRAAAEHEGAVARLDARRFTACRPTAIGSVSAAWRASSPFGTSSSSGADSSIRSP